MLRDLGSHVVDQMLWLLGPARAVTAHLDHVDLPKGRTDAGFVVDLQHTSGVRSLVESSKLNQLAVRELRAYGSAGSYRHSGIDVQAQAIFAGQRPVDLGDAWGYEAESRWGTVNTADGSHPVPSERGAYQDYYTQFAAAIAGTAPFPVPAGEAIHTLEVLDAARLSATEHRVVSLDENNSDAHTKP